MCKIFVIYPIDKSSSTGFLNRINTFGKRNLGKDWKCFKLYFQDADHTNAIRKAQKYRFILFMGHGCETHLCGACGPFGEESISDTVRTENPKFYNNYDFINRNNICEFKNKIFCSFSCNSNRNTSRSLGRYAIQSGVIAFIGFGNIPTDFINGLNISNRCISDYKGIIIRIMKYAIFFGIKYNLTVESFVKTIKFLTTKEIHILMKSKYKIRHKDCIIKLLVDFKNEIKIMGDKYARLCESNLK